MRHIQEPVQQEKSGRPWVKNAAIVFLSVMLALTFFSKTIMNISLPEVSGQYTASGTISESVAGAGTVKANLAYNVQLEQTRTVKSVAVQPGDTVEEGQVLFTLEEMESDALKTARDELSQMEYDYQVALVQAVDASYAVQGVQIQGLQDQLNAAIADRDEAAVNEQAYDAAQAVVQTEQQTVNALQSEIADLQGRIALQGIDDAELLSLQASLAQAQAVQTDAAASCSAAEAELTTARANATASVASLQSALADAQAALDQADSTLAAAQQGLDAFGGDTGAEGYAAAQQAVAAAQTARDQAQTVRDQAQAALDADPSAAALAQAQAKRDQAQSVLDSASQSLAAAQQAVDSRKAELADPALARQLAEKQAALGSAQARLGQAQSDLATLTPASYETADQTVKTLQQSLASSYASLYETQKQDGIAAETTQLDLERREQLIEEKKQQIEDMEADESNTKVKAQYAGTVASVSAVPGDVAAAGTTLASINVDGKEFSMSVPVSLEQAQKLTVGAAARVTNFYYGEVQAVLSAIRDDPDAPGKSKLLDFNISGDVVDGQSLSVSIDLGSQNYTAVVPKSALRQDQDGDFVYAASSKDSPLGTRYVVDRVAVTVLATDASSAAIETLSGYGNYYVVTTSTAPLSDGEQVRIAGS